MIRLGLIGHPLGHSMSPRIHAAALKAGGLEGSYSLFPVQADDDGGLNDLLIRVRAGEIQGLNVTIPHKQKVMHLIDELTPTARAIGAVNTIHLHEKKLIGDNTDAQGFLLDLKRFLAAQPHRPGETNALVLGAGGSARAVVYALIQDGWKVSIATRRMEQALQLADSYKQHTIRVTDYDPFTFQSSAFSLLVNTTPVGMTPDVSRSPWPENLQFPNSAVYDLVYNPVETKLVQDARSRGLPATTGLGMLIEQAALAFEIWTGYNPPRDILLDSVAE